MLAWTRLPTACRKSHRHTEVVRGELRLVRGSHPHWLHWPGHIAALAGAMIAFAAPAAAADPFEIRAAQVAAQQGVYLLNATLHLDLPEGARQAVRDGVTLTLELQLELQRARRWWLDDTVATLEQRYELSYHALSEYYLLRNVNSGEQHAFASFDAALDSLSKVRDLPVLDQSLIEAEEAYDLRLRARLDVRTLPSSLRMVLFWVDDWRQRTDWYVWPLKR